jgi:nucleoside-diphosphate-sugar epimerase
VQSKLRILITGTTGWLGGQLAAALVAQGHTVVGASRRQTDIAGVESLQLDVCDAEGVAAAFNARPLPFDCVVHLAGTLGWCSSQQAVDVNVGGTRVVVEAALHSGCAKIVVASSVALTGTCTPSHPPPSLPWAVDAPNVRGPWPYAYSKSSKEELCAMLASLPQHRGCDLLAVRIGNTVTDPPDIVHHDGMGITYPVPPASSRDVDEATVKKDGFSIFPEAPLCSIALSDQVNDPYWPVLARIDRYDHQHLLTLIDRNDPHSAY